MLTLSLYIASLRKCIHPVPPRSNIFCPVTYSVLLHILSCYIFCPVLPHASPVPSRSVPPVLSAMFCPVLFRSGSFRSVPFHRRLDTRWCSRDGPLRRCRDGGCGASGSSAETSLQSASTGHGGWVWNAPGDPDGTAPNSGDRKTNLGQEGSTGRDRWYFERYRHSG